MATERTLVIEVKPDEEFPLFSASRDLSNPEFVNVQPILNLGEGTMIPFKVDCVPVQIPKGLAWTPLGLDEGYIRSIADDDPQARLRKLNYLLSEKFPRGKPATDFIRYHPRAEAITIRSLPYRELGPSDSRRDMVKDLFLNRQTREFKPSVKERVSQIRATISFWREGIGYQGLPTGIDRGRIYFDYFYTLGRPLATMEIQQEDLRGSFLRNLMRHPGLLVVVPSGNIGLKTVLGGFTLER